MTRTFEFSCDFPHPDNPNIYVRYIIREPAFSAEGLPDGTVMERHLVWRSNDRG